MTTSEREFLGLLPGDTESPDLLVLVVLEFKVSLVCVFVLDIKTLGHQVHIWLLRADGALH